MSKTKQELWEERVQSFLVSGLSRRAWCLEQNIPEHQLGYWLRKLESNMPAESESKRWVRMQTTPLGDSGITIQIGDVVLSVKQGFDHQVLVDVVRALTAVC